ncbi:hypothetical protein FTW19_17740 [Terriglobus albidus]|uniref:Uncharacterized protein n=1 Tax=Terriglobus albidus TaxID=1592106 RepID=A0A5B9EHW3_9BACT|nr:hypothetical protein FTW19_17740 [Terriglobus albidus]
MIHLFKLLLLFFLLLLLLLLLSLFLLFRFFLLLLSLCALRVCHCRCICVVRRSSSVPTVLFVDSGDGLLLCGLRVSLDDGRGRLRCGSICCRFLRCGSRSSTRSRRRVRRRGRFSSLR